MLSLFRLKETSRRLREGDWSPKNDLFCLGFFLFVEWGSTPAVGDKVTWWFYIYKGLTVFLIYLCWEANKGARGSEFLRRFLAFYRCHMLRLWLLFISFVVISQFAGFAGCLLSGNFRGAFDGECAPFIAEYLASLLDIHPFFPGFNQALGGIGYLTQFRTVRDFIFWGVVAFFWRSVYSSLAELSMRRSLPLLPEGSDSLSDLQK